MMACAARFMALLIDFDGQGNRLDEARTAIPVGLRDRVLVIGSWTTPEDLRSRIGSSYETIGRALATDCCEGTNTTWQHELLRHNDAEVERLRKHIQPILFPMPV
jgi:hypothetical protein